jgi:hypothetical protein
MFLVNDNYSLRRKKILSFITETDTPIAVLLAAANFEWTVGRAIMALGNSPNTILRPMVENCSGLERYKDLWKDEVTIGQPIKRLPVVVTNWSEFVKAFELRHLLEHSAIKKSCIGRDVEGLSRSFQ